MNPTDAVTVKWFRAGYLIPAILLLAFIYFLTPRGWAPGGESWGAWAAARVLADTGGFPVFSRNVLYTAYLTLFLKLPFPTSVILEYWITHFFALVAVYLLMRSSLGMTKSLILMAAMTPSLAVLEGGGTVAAIGFFSLYLRTFVTAKPGTWPLLPAALLAAALCHSAYGPFLVLHLLVSGYIWWREKSRRMQVCLNYGRVPENVLLLLLAAFAVTAFVLQSDRIDNNHMLMDPRFAPIPLTSAINIGFFQISTWDLVEKFNDPAVLATKDWYFETPKFFGTSQTILEVIKNDPRLFFSLAFWKVDYYLVLLPVYFYSFGPIFGASNIVVILALKAMSILLLLMLLIGLLKIYRARGAAALFVLIVGSAGLIAAYLLTAFNFRYVATLLPVFLLAYTAYLRDSGTGITWPYLENSGLKSCLFFLGCALILGHAPFGAIGDPIADECIGQAKPANFTAKAYRHACLKFKGAEYQMHAVVDGGNFLDRPNGVSMNAAYPALSKLIDQSSHILSGEPTFFSGFTSVSIANNRQIMSLPPYIDTTEYTGHLLDEIDVFLISENLARDAASVSTQSFLRYKLHILPYLNANKAMFRIVRVPRYGNAYVRKVREESTSGALANPLRIDK